MGPRAEEEYSGDGGVGSRSARRWLAGWLARSLARSLVGGRWTLSGLKKGLGRVIT